MTSGIEAILAQMRASPNNIRDVDLMMVCGHFFEEPRQTGGSHAVYKMPWIGDPRVNIQKDKSGKAKAYRVKQVLAAIAKLQGEKS